MRSFQVGEVKVIETRDLILRPLVSTDLDAYFALCSNPEVMRTWGTFAHRDRQQTEALLAFLEEGRKQNRMIRWAITEKNSGKFIGDIGYWRFVPERFRGETGAKLVPEVWSRGYMSQALSAVIEHGFQEMGLNSVEANVDPKNLAAIRLVEKLGFSKEGELKQHSYCPFTETFIDTDLFSVLKNSWKNPYPFQAGQP